MDYPHLFRAAFAFGCLVAAFAGYLRERDMWACWLLVGLILLGSV